MTLEKVRLDRWLWAARFYKTRAYAVSDIKRGRVTINAQKVKPAKQIVVGDAIRIRKAQLVFNVTVSALSEKRLGAKLAQLLYDEPAGSIEARALQLQQNQAARQILIDGRPNKKHRRRQQALKRHIE